MGTTDIVRWREVAPLSWFEVDRGGDVLIFEVVGDVDLYGFVRAVVEVKGDGDGAVSDAVDEEERDEG